jgi:membrane carboxypeptidase/penicillin-binding protein PbpC
MDGKNPTLPLKSEGAVGLVHWYLDDAFVGTAERWGAVTVEPGPGRHRVSLMDSRNMTARSEFTVVEAAPLDGGPDAARLLVFE